MAILKKADKEMTATLAPYRKKINELKEERHNVASYHPNPNKQYYNTEIYNQRKKIEKIDNEIDKQEEKMSKAKETLIRARENWKKVLRTTRA